MTRKLNSADRHAIDLLLNRAADGNGDANFVAAAAPQPRVQAVETILKVLDVMPDADPPADLVTRTLHRIARSASPLAAPEMPRFIDPSQPMA